MECGTRFAVPRLRVTIRGDTFGEEPANIQWNHNPNKHSVSLDARGDATAVVFAA
jgi:hypothetical protein